MLVVALGVIGVLSPFVAWRWPAGLLLNRWKFSWLVWATLAFQVVVLEVAMPTALASVLHVVTYAVAIAFLWLNRRVQGALVVGAGAFSNGLTIALNGGTLPASKAAVEAAGFDHSMEFANSAVLENPVLPWLGDVFAWPSPMPLANTFSVGDVLIVVGVFVAAWAGSRRFGAAVEAAPQPDAANAADADDTADAGPRQ